MLNVTAPTINVTSDINKNKENFISLLKSTKRDGVEKLISSLEQMGFFEAPASATHHLNKTGGLTEHSINTYNCAVSVWETMKQLDPAIEKEISIENIIIASLLHDICKANFYQRTEQKIKTNSGNIEIRESFKTNYCSFPFGHGEKSALIAAFSGMKLTDAEILAIRWHMGPWSIKMWDNEERKNYDTARNLYPLVTITHIADTLAASILERNK